MIDTGSRQPDLLATRPPTIPIWIAVAVLILAIALAMGPIATSGFSYWDDEETISLNPDLNPPTWVGLADRWTRSHLHIYIPLTHSVWHVLALVSPKTPDDPTANFVAWPFKLTSLAVHAMTSALVLLILRKLVGPGVIALIAAMVFAVHPLQVESVGWTSGLKDLLFGLFSGGCVLAYLGGAADAVRPRGTMVLLAMALLVLAALSKPTAMVVPVMLLALDLVWLRRPAKQSIARLVPFAIIGIAFAMYAARVQSALSPESLPPFWLRPLVAIDSLAFYVNKLVLPINLAYDYGRNAHVALTEARAMPAWMAAKILLAIAIIGLGAFCWRRAPLVTLGLLWAAICIGPVLGLTYFDFAHYSTVADHYAYLPLLGVAVVFAGGVQLTHAKPALVHGIAAMLVLAWIGLSFRQSLTWHDSLATTLQSLRVNDRSAASWGNLALWELRAGRVDDAEKHATKSVALAPDDPQSLFLLANVRQERGDLPGAIELLRQAIKISPYKAAFHHRLATLLGRVGQLDEALDALDRTLALDPRYPNAQEQRTQLRIFVQQQRATTRPATRP